MSQKVELKLDWCSYQAARYAVEKWHYSARMPTSKLAKIGVWENGIFVGAVIFGSGANNGIGKRFGLTQFEICELVRVALMRHNTEVSRIVTIALRMIKNAFPRLRIVISFADPEYGHVGSIYQAMGWIYGGMTTPADEFIVKGKRLHGRGLRSSLAGMKLQRGTTLERAQLLDRNATKIKGSAKHRYFYPLDEEMRNRLELLRKAYPKRASSETIDTAGYQLAKGGAAPTDALHLSN